MNEYISLKHDRRIIWKEKSDIVHFDLKGKLLHREKHTPKVLKRIISFLEHKNEDGQTLIAQFNKAARAVMEDINGIDLHPLVDTENFISGSVNNSAACKNKIYRHVDKNQEITQLYIRNTSIFKPNMRYYLEVNNGLVLFTEHEELRSDNLNKKYDEEILSIYVMH